MEYKVELLIDNTYQVVEYIQQFDGNPLRDIKFQGSLSDCEAWIRLTVGGYL